MPALRIFVAANHRGRSRSIDSSKRELQNVQMRGHTVLSLAMLAVLSACASNSARGLVSIEGGALPSDAGMHVIEPYGVPTKVEWQWAARGRDEGRSYPSVPLGASRDGVLDLVGNVSEFVLDDEHVRLVGGSALDAYADEFRVSQPHNSNELPSEDLRGPSFGFRCVEV